MNLRRASPERLETSRKIELKFEKNNYPSFPKLVNKQSETYKKHQNQNRKKKRRSRKRLSDTDPEEYFDQTFSQKKYDLALQEYFDELKSGTIELGVRGIASKYKLKYSTFQSHVGRLIQSTQQIPYTGKPPQMGKIRFIHSDS